MNEETLEINDVFLRTVWTTQLIRGLLLAFILGAVAGFLYISGDFYGSLMISTDVYGFLWISLDFF